MSDFSFAGEHSTVYHVRLLKSPISVLPGTRDKVITLPGRHGALRMLPDLSERSLQLECWLAANTITELHTRLEGVRAWLNPLRGAQRLIFDSTSDRFYNTTYAGGSLDTEITALQGLFTVDFVCPDPFVYAVTPDIVTILTSPYAHTQRGTAPADPLFRLQGVSSGAGGQQISITVGTQTVTYRGALATGEWLEIDSRDKTAVRVVGVSRTRVLPLLEKPVFPQLLAGANTITITPAGGATWSRLELHCRNRWL
jgi:predicted phage tail component-like protein